MLYNLQQIKELAEKIATSLKPGDMILLNGQLGAGKSTFSKFVIESLGFDYCGSPTFSKIITYQGDLCCWHCDLYQMDNIHPLQECIYEIDHGILLVEWAEKLPELSFLSDIIELKIDYHSEELRKLHITKKGRFEKIDF